MYVGDVNEAVDAEIVFLYRLAIAVLFVLEGIVHVGKAHGEVYAGMVVQCHGYAGTDAQTDLVQGEVGAEGRVVPVAQYMAVAALIAQGNVREECPAQLAVNRYISAPEGFGIVEGVGIVHVAIGVNQCFILVLCEEGLLPVGLAVAHTQADDAVVAYGTVMRYVRI